MKDLFLSKRVELPLTSKVTNIIAFIAYGIVRYLLLQGVAIVQLTTRDVLTGRHPLGRIATSPEARLWILP